MSRTLPILLTALTLAACGNSTEEPAGDRPPKEVFAGTCGGCHALDDAGTDGSFGPNLDELKPDKARVLKAIEEGPGGMPNSLLKGGAADAVAAYVATASGG